MADKVFIKGMIAKRPHEKAPSYVIASISIKAEDLIAFIQEYKKPDGWLNVSIKESKGGKYYAELDTWEKGKKAEESNSGGEIGADEDIPY